MVVSLLANIGIILLNIYVLWKLNLSYLEFKPLSTKQVLTYAGIETLVGTALLHFSVVIFGSYFDLRSVLFAISMQFLGKKVTLLSMVSLAVIRFVFDGSAPAVFNAVGVLILLFTYDKIYEWAKKRYNGLGRFLTLSYHYISVMFPFTVYLLQDWGQAILIYSALVVTSTIMIFIIYSILSDVQYLSDLSEVDNLTNLYNSRKLQADFKHLSSGNGDYALIVIDIDDFKNFNDKYGHLTGDVVLRELSIALASLPDENSNFYRYGGEEFVTIIEDCNGSKAAELAEMIQQRIKAISIITGEGHTLEVTVSIGVAHRLRKEELITTFERADQALYRAKENGKDQIIIS